ncbi:DNA ligase D [Cellvibrio mixtus]|uniref:DNA ligase D n=1 Tax=Cellvibrio mixtus TaxID=39650 RepID=UPI00058742CD|nr:DNA ligase D [Cellvibrio mixtus]
MAKPLREYHRKRNFDVTTEPRGEDLHGKKKSPAHALQFVIQKHDARRLHYDFRLEMNGTLLSWAIPKGPSLDPKDKRLAVHVEDHPLDYASFEGHIPEGHYGGGDVIVWDRGVWEPEGNPAASYKAGKLKFTLIGEKLTGGWTLVRTNLRGSGDKEQWLLIKERDESARAAEDYDVVVELPQSVVSGALIDPEKRKKNKASVTQKTATKTTAKTGANASSENAKKKASAHSAKSAANAVNAISPAKKTTKEITLPEMIAPELATLVSEPPAGDWLYEIKFDGYRILSRIENGEVKLITRNGNDWTERMPLQAKAIAELGLTDSWLDGEVVVLNDDGIPDFQKLQRAFEIGRSQQILYYLFDAPFLNGVDMRERPVEERRAALQKIIPGKAKNPLRFSAAFLADHRNIVESACSMSLEGVIGKRAGSPYLSRRSPDWIKLKCRLRQEFVIIGYTKPQGSRTGFGALLLGVYAQPKSSELLYAGRVGTGFNDASLKQCHKKLTALETTSSPLTTPLSGALARGVHWVKPTLVCEVEFAEWTGDNILRQAAFIAMRTDKPAREIIREHAIKPPVAPHDENTKSPKAKSVKAGADNLAGIPIKTLHGKTTTAKNTGVKNGRGKTTSATVADIKITHPERIIDSESGATKLELAQFYEYIAPWLLPHIQDRPVSLLRAPQGVGGEQFFQKHAEHMAIPHMHHLDPSLDPGHARLMQIDTPQALVGAAQMGTIELHTWGSTSEDIETPERIIFDLDPDPVLPWRSITEAATLTLAVLDELKLDAFLKTSGGKGLHIVVPLARKFSWDYVKEFSKALSQFMAKQIPDRFVAKMGPQNRVGKLFIDYLRNQRGASTVCAYSVRARPGLPVSVPITRDEIKKLKGPAQWHIGNLAARLEKLKADPWKGYTNQQELTAAMWKKLGAKPPQ